MKEPQQQTLQINDEATFAVSGEETTLVSPRFDDEETLVARPVVPLEGDAHERPDAQRAPNSRRPFAPRRSKMLVLALISVLGGGVLGGAGLYLYQRQSETPAATTTQPDAPADAAQGPTAPDAEGPNTTPSEAPVRQTEVPADAAQNAEEPPAPSAVDEQAPAAARAPATVPATERRTTPDEGSAPKRGKKGERDAETERRAAPRRDGNITRADQREARRVDSIVYRPRRAARRARRDDDVDRLRRIFEGTPE